MSSTTATGKRPLDVLSRLLDTLWIEEKVVWSAALLTMALFAVVDLPFSVRRVAGPYALFLGRIAAIVVVMVAVQRLWLRFVAKRRPEPFTQNDVWCFLRTLGFYLVALTTYTNLKTHTLMLHPRVFDGALETLDRWLFLGHSPTGMALGLAEGGRLTGLMDTAYTFAWVPLAIIFGVVFSQSGGEGFRRLARVISLNYLLGAVLYVLIPAVGPAFMDRELYEPLRQSRSFLIQNSLINVHNQIVAAPSEFLVPAFMGIAAFPSLHVSHIYLPLLEAWKRARVLLVLFVPAFLLVSLSTAYFGWHWVIDIPAGMATIHVCYWLARRMDPAERRAEARREARRHSRAAEGATGTSTPEALGQWPVIAALGGLHLLGLIIAFALLAPGASLAWGSAAALVFFLFFWVLLEVCLVTGVAGLVETNARQAWHPWIDGAKATLLGLGFTLSAASLLKLRLTGSHLAGLDLWFLFGNLRQIAGESSGLEIVLLVGLLVLWALVGRMLFRGFTRRRSNPSPLPVRHLALLGVLALLGAIYPVYRYTDTRAMALRVVPELGWMVSAPAPPAVATAAAEPVTLDGPSITPWTPGSPSERPNVLLVMLESVPADVLTWPEAEQALPNLTALARDSLTFSRAYAPSVHSDYAQMAILSSLHPRKYETHDYYQQLDYPRTLIWDLLAPAGWETAAFSCQNEEWGNMLAYLRTSGLGSIRHSLDWPQAPRKGRGNETKVFEPTVVGAWQEWLDELPTGQSDAPWLAYLNFQATHFPYEIPANAPRLFEPHEIDFAASFLHYPQDKIPVIRNRYLNALAYSDHYLGEVRRELEERGLTDETILVVVSDHGEAFYEHGQPTHGTQLFEEQINSLLMIRLPGEPVRRVEEPVSLMDVVPSLARHLGLPPHGNLQGRDDILEPGYSAEGRPFHFTIQGMTSEDAILLNDWKYSFNWRTGAEQLFNLETDPDERHNLVDEYPDQARALAFALGRFLGRQLTYYAEAGWEAGRYPAGL